VRERVLADESVALTLTSEKPHAHRGRRHGTEGGHRLRRGDLRRGRGDGQVHDAVLGPVLDLDHEIEMRDAAEVEKPGGQ